jgi:hypothetical protein
MINLTSDLIFSPLFIGTVDSDFSRYLYEGLRFLEFNPEILDRIYDDQEQRGEELKKVRIEDQAFQNRNHPKLSFCEFSEGDDNYEILNEDIKLGIGRARMSPKVLFVYFMSEQYLKGSTTDKYSRSFLAESETIHAFLMNNHLSQPKRSTIHDNLRCISINTIKLILDAQIQYIQQEEIDSFHKMYIDSTSIHANTKWPTDSGMILGLVHVLSRLLKKMHKHMGVEYIDNVIIRWVKELKSLDLEINLVAGKKTAEATRKKCYKKIYKISDKSVIRLLKSYLAFKNTHNLSNILPSLKTTIQSEQDLFENSLKDLRNINEYSFKRIFEGKSTKASDKIASISDKNATFIIKGGRDTVVGYKPQIAISDNMFITSILVPEGNASDSVMLSDVVDDVIQRTNTTPELLSVDDGYSSIENFESMTAKGIDTVSISGSKGKKVIDSVDEDLWKSENYVNGRNHRSKAESIMFSMKHIFGLGQLKARGIDSVRRELLSKAIGYNFYRMALLKDIPEKISA